MAFFCFIYSASLSKNFSLHSSLIVFVLSSRYTMSEFIDGFKELSVQEEQKLLDVLSQLKKAIECEDLVAVSELNNVIKSGVERAVQDATSESEKNSVKALLNQIQVLYQLLISNTEESRSKISLELKKISSDKRAANFYLKSSQYR